MKLFLKDYESLKEAMELCLESDWEIYGCEESSVRDFLRREEKYGNKLPGLPYSKNNLDFEDIWDKCDKLAPLFLKDRSSDLLFLGDLEVVNRVYPEKLYLVKKGTVLGDFAKTVKFKKYGEKEFNLEAKQTDENDELECFEVPDITINLNEELNFTKYIRKIALLKRGETSAVFKMTKPEDMEVVENIYEKNVLNFISFLLASKYENSQSSYFINELVVRNIEKCMDSIVSLDKKNAIMFFKVFIDAMKKDTESFEVKIVELAKKLPKEWKEDIAILHNCLNVEDVGEELLVGSFKNSNLEMKIDFKKTESILNVGLTRQIKKSAKIISKEILDSYGYNCVEFHEIQGNVFLEVMKKNYSKPDLTKEIFLSEFAKACAYILNSEHRFSQDNEVIRKVLGAWLEETQMRKDLQNYSDVQVSSHKIKKF